MPTAATEKCQHCRGDGYFWRVPDGFNPFSAGGWATARASEKVHCYECAGTGKQFPEIWVECPECCGEGSIEEWESVSRWSLDPPCAHVVPCKACDGAGGWLNEVEADHA